MSWCVEKPFVPLLAVWSYLSVSPRAPPRDYGMGHGVSVTGGRYFCRSKPNAAPS